MQNLGRVSEGFTKGPGRVKGYRPPSACPSILFISPGGGPTRIARESDVALLSASAGDAPAAGAAGFRVQGSGFRVQGSGFQNRGSGFRIQGSGFVVYDLWFYVLWFMVYD